MKNGGCTQVAVHMHKFSRECMIFMYEMHVRTGKGDEMRRGGLESTSDAD